MINQVENKQKAVILTEREVFDRTFVVYGTPEAPLFLAKDVAEMIDYSKSGNGSYNLNRMLNSIDESEKLILPLLVAGQNRDVAFVTEDGLYEILMQSRKPIAKQFKTKVKEILKSIRQEGMYMTPQVASQVLENPTGFLAHAVLVADKEIQKLKQALAEQAPKVQTYDEYMHSNRTHSFTDVGKLLGITATDIINFLIRKGILMRNIKKEAYPTKAWEESGYFHVSVHPKYIHTRVTPKGFEWLTNMLQANAS